MSRWSRFAMFQRAAWRQLFRRRSKARLLAESDALANALGHPSSLCKCGPHGTPHMHLAHSDHQPGCAWMAAACKTCGGDGCCTGCGGDGVEPTAEGSA